MKLTDVCYFQGGSQPPKNQWSDEPREGYIRMLQIRDFTQDNSKVEYVKITNSTKKCEEKDILIARYGASIGKILTGLSGAYNVAMMKVIFENAYGDKNVVEVVRNIVGLDPATASGIFSKYINENQLNMRQIQFVKLLIDYVIKNGTIDMIALTEDPFRAVGEVGELFEDKYNTFMEIRRDIEIINENAKELA